MNHFKNFLISLVIILMIDLVWLGIVAKGFYNKELVSFSRTLRLPAAILAYILLALGISLFVLPRVPGKGLLAFLWGAIFGLIAYGVYDLTNLAILTNWTLKMTVVDMLWGATICGLTTLIVSLIIK